MGERPWRFVVSHELADNEDPNEDWWTWAIFDGPTDPDDLVLSGVVDTGDPTPVLEQIVARHNAEQPQGRVLWQGKTRPPPDWCEDHGDSAVTVYGLPLPPGTEVAVVVVGDSHGETE